MGFTGTEKSLGGLPSNTAMACSYCARKSAHSWLRPPRTPLSSWPRQRRCNRRRRCHIAPGCILAIVVLIPWMFQLVVEFLVGLMGKFAVLVIFVNLIVDIVILMFAYWFLAECICDSAEGNLRVPNTADNTPGLAEMGLRLIRIFVCLVVYLFPASLYYRYTYRCDLPFQIIAGCGIFLYPMALLGVLMFDSIRGLTPP